MPSGSTPVAVGFGGYVGNSRLDHSLATEDSSPYLVIFVNFDASLSCLVHIVLVAVYVESKLDHVTKNELDMLVIFVCLY